MMKLLFIELYIFIQNSYGHYKWSKEKIDK